MAHEKDCIFCKIVNGEIPSKKLYETNEVMAFEDINPLAPIHYLIIPKRHIATLNDLETGDVNLSGEMILAATKLARDSGVDERGYRLIMNCNRDGGQEIYHIHLHLLGGKQLGPMLAR